jgi:hypothetical protein
VGTWRHVDPNSGALQLTFAEHLQAINLWNLLTQPVYSNQDVNCCEPMEHERSITRGASFFSRAVVFLNRYAETLQVLPALPRKRVDIRR